MLKYFISISGVIACICLFSCANQTTPAGGPKDEDPPKLLSSSPRHKQKNFDKKEITLEFDEFVALSNAKDEILISPSPGKKIIYTVKKTKVTIEPEDGWQDSTTYSVSFREGIRDITENNAPENLKLAFSTGPTIDSLEIRGKVKFAISEDIPEKITIAIYKSDTFDIFQHTPSYFTMSTKSGAFSIENIKDGEYYIYAFGDNNKNLKVESRSESFGFLSKPIILSNKIDSVTIPLVKLDTRLLKINSIRNNGLTTTVKFNKYITQYNLKYQDPELVIHSYGSDQTEVVMYNPADIVDSLQFHINGIDSLANTADTTFYIKSTDNKFLRDNFTASSTRPTFDLPSSSYNLKINLSKPLYAFTADSMFIRLDSLVTIPVSTESFSYDTIKKQLMASIKVVPDSLFKDGRKPELVFSPSSFISFELDSSKAIKHALTRVKAEDTGILLIDVQTKAENFIIQLLSGDNEIMRTSTNEKKISFKNLPAQSYKLRAIVDTNNNGTWDAGNIFQQVEPEKTIYYEAPDNKFTFPIRANWELGPLLLKF